MEILRDLKRTSTPVLAQRLERLLRQFTVWNEECEFIIRAVNAHEDMKERLQIQAENNRAISGKLRDLAVKSGGGDLSEELHKLADVVYSDRQTLQETIAKLESPPREGEGK